MPGDAELGHSLPERRKGLVEGDSRLSRGHLVLLGEETDGAGPGISHHSPSLTALIHAPTFVSPMSPASRVSAWILVYPSAAI